MEGLGRVSLSWYVTSADFVVDASANSQSEFLQFSLYMVGTVWLPQRGGAVIQASGNQQVVLEHGRPEHLEDPRVGPSPCR